MSWGAWMNAAIQAYGAYSAAKEAKKGDVKNAESYHTPYGNEYIAPLVRFILDQESKVYNSRQNIYGGPKMGENVMASILAGVPQNYSGVGKPGHAFMNTSAGGGNYIGSNANQNWSSTVRPQNSARIAALDDSESDRRVSNMTRDELESYMNQMRMG